MDALQSPGRRARLIRRARRGRTGHFAVQSEGKPAIQNLNQGSGQGQQRDNGIPLDAEPIHEKGYEQQTDRDCPSLAERVDDNIRSKARHESGRDLQAPVLAAGDKAQRHSAPARGSLEHMGNAEGAAARGPMWTSSEGAAKTHPEQLVKMKIHDLAQQKSAISRLR
jgi:hypothetical protein